MTTSPTAPAVAVTGLRKSYGDVQVLDGVDLHVPRGSVLALLGPNGAGKTTIVQILSTLVQPDAGDLRVAGHDVVADPDAVRAVIGVTGQFSAVDQLLTGRENLRLMADLHHLPKAEGRARTDRLLDRFGLLDAADRPAQTYSGGMRRRLDLAMTLLGDPQLIFLDEPTTGLDPRSRRAMWQRIEELVAAGVTVLLTTQHLDEADHLADRIAVLDRGRIVAEGTPAELKRLAPGGHILVELADQSSLEQAVALLPEAACDTAKLSLQVPGDGSLQALRDLLAQLDGDAVSVTSVAVHTPDLDDVFFALTGHPAGDDPQEMTP